MAFLIDTDVVIHYLADDPATVQLVATLAAQGASISVVTFIEALHGILVRPHPDFSRQKFESFLDDVPMLPLTRNVAERCAEVRADLTRQQRRVRPRALDLIIAATALEYGLILVTRNANDYRDILGVSLY